MKSSILFLNFFILISTSMVAQAQSTSPRSCLERLPKLLCIIAPRPADQVGTPPKECVENDPDTDKFIAEFTKIYNVMPPSHQGIFCTLQRIYVERSPHVGGFSGFVTKGTLAQATGTVFTIGADIVLNPNETVADSLLKTNLSAFDIGPDDHKIATMVAPENPKLNMILGNYIMHEFSHLLDGLNNVNGFTPECIGRFIPKDLHPNCVPAPHGFAALSWNSQTDSMYDATVFPDRKQLYGYFRFMQPDLPYGDPNKAVAVLTELNATSFISALAATQAYDDWADSNAVLWIAEHTSGPIVMTMIDSGIHYDLRAQIASAAFAPKLASIKKFSARQDLNYPDPFKKTEGSSDEADTVLPSSGHGHLRR